MKATGSAQKTRAQTAAKRAVKVGLDRFDKILRLARRRSGATMRELQDELEVSLASVKRDIEFLRDRMNCPIEWNRQRQRYVVRDDLAAGGRFELPGLWLDAGEVFALLTMQHLVEGMQPGLLEEHVAPLKQRLDQILAAGGKSAKHLQRKVKLIHFAPRRVEPKHFSMVATGLLESKQLRLRYFGRDKQEHTERVISPLQLVHYRENWYLDAWCHLRQQLRTFALEAIEQVGILPEAAIEVSEEQMRAHFQSGYGIFAGRAQHRAQLKFTRERAQYVSLETWHPDQTSETLADGSYLLQVPYSNNQELVMDLLRYGSEVEVLAPPALRQKMHDLLRAAAVKYEQPGGSLSEPAGVQQCA